MSSEEKSVSIPMESAALEVRVGRDGTWLLFTSEGGKSAALNVDLMRKDGIIGAALQEWCTDRQRQAAVIRENEEKNS